MTKSKIFNSCQEVVADIPDGATIMLGTFGPPGDTPQNLMKALRDQGAKQLTVIVSSTGSGGFIAAPVIKALGRNVIAGIDSNILVENKQVKKFITAFTFPNSATGRAILAGEVEVEYVPIGTLAERIRAGGFGIGGFYTPTGVGTMTAEGKETRIIGGKEFLFELPLKADYALIRAYKADKFGNLIYRGNTMTYGPIMAAAAQITIVEVEEIVEVGELAPEAIVVSEIFIDRIVKTPRGVVQ